MIVRTVIRPLFPLGQVYGTPGALEALKARGLPPAQFLDRHVSGDWGDLEDGDKRENDFALTRRLRIFSAYQVDDEFKLWIITEADRSSTTLLLPSEY